jgi:flagellar L-ring protein precursor FlgH
MRIMKQVTISITALFSIWYSAGAGNVYSLYTDHRAMRKDDLLTVLIVENAKAGSQSSTNTNKKNSFGVDNVRGSGSLGFIPGFGASGSASVGYDGEGGTRREGNLVATVSARVTQVLDNGNLVIQGDKVVAINDEKEIIKISGVVRPQDIESDNTIYSYNISDAQITYSGKGVANTGRRPGIFARLLNLIF